MSFVFVLTGVGMALLSLWYLRRPIGRQIAERNYYLMPWNKRHDPHDPDGEDFEQFYKWWRGVAWLLLLWGVAWIGLGFVLLYSQGL